MKKQLPKYLLISALTILFIFVLVRIAVGYTYKEDSNAESFLSGRYVKYNGGREAAEFFEEYVDLKDYKEIAFNYSDAEKAISFYKYHTCFVVDIYYEDETFISVAHNILAKAGYEDRYLEEAEPQIGNFIPVKVSLSEKMDEKHSCCVLFDRDFSTVRYAFVYKCGNEDASETTDWINHIIHPNWNSEYRGELLDPVFDYDE